ncbi:MAG: M42 family metallopeptidase [Trueperaceae bacterium]|nr:M42 family metallopeptidase [Trueperaceae bacterium]
MNFDKDFFKALLAAPGPSSFESRPAKVWQEQAKTYGAKLETDPYGNSFASFGETGCRVMLSGHIDEIGLMATYIDKEGFIYFSAIGGWDPEQLIGQRVRVLGYQGDILGVIGKKAIHLMSAEDKRKNSSLDEMWIDIGASSKEEAKRYVREGDVAVIEQAYIELLNDRVVSKAIDNRIGAYIVLEAARRAQNPEALVTATATVQEEIGHIGALVASYGLEPHVAIAVDVTHATDTPGISKQRSGDVPFSSGASLTIGSITHRGVFNALIEAAENNNIAYTIEASPRRTATDGDDIVKTRRGVPTAVVSVPTRYMHSPNETIDLKDVEACIALIVAFINTLKADSRFTQP